MTVKTEDLKSILECAVCLNIYENPVTIPCGHTFCLDCLLQIQSESKTPKLAHCPICRKSFRAQKKHFWNRSISMIKLIDLLKQSEKRKILNFSFELNLEALSPELKKSFFN